MRIPRISLLIVPILLLSLGYLLLGQPIFWGLSQSQCYAPPTTSRQSAWAKNATVKYYIDPNLSQDKKVAVREVINNWNNAKGSSGNNSNVTFEENSTPISGTNTLNVKGWATGTGNYAIASSTPGAQNLDRATIEINNNISSLDVFKKTVAHEIGHTFGLAHFSLSECGGCSANSSVMADCPGAQGNNFNCANGTTGPTSCDNTAANTVGSYGSSGGGGGSGSGGGQCPPCESNEVCDPLLGMCYFISPIILDAAGNGFDLTDAANGVLFDINGDGRKEQISWTSTHSDEAGQTHYKFRHHWV